MLRLTALALLFANAAWFAWSQGMLLPWGLGPAQQAEPHRVWQQIRPEAVRVLSPEEAQRLAETPPPRAPDCLASPPLEDAAVAGLRKLLAAWPAGSWTLEPAVEPGRWIVYMGKYPTREALEKKKSELRARGVAFEALANAALEPGLSLGGFTTQAAAKEYLSVLSGKGVRTAVVVQERTDLRGTALRLPAVDDALRPRLEELRPALGAQALRACR